LLFFLKGSIRIKEHMCQRKRHSKTAAVPDGIVGESWSVDDLKEVGMRVISQERLSNVREGINQEDDTLHERLLNEPKPDGRTAAVVVPRKEPKNDFYKTMGHDPSTGNPPDSLLARLGFDK
jgi:aldehyde:ferredoxin oxidoreductase